MEQAKPESKRTEVPEPGTSEDRTPGKDSEDSGERYSLKEPGGDNPFQAPASSLAKLKSPAKALAGALNKSWLAEAVEIVTLPLETRLEKEGQGAGRGLMDALRRARDMGEVSAGKRLARLLDATLNKLTRAQRFNLLDVLEGRDDPESGTVRDAFQVARAVLDDIAGEAEDLEVMIQTSEGKQPFEAVEDYFPHMLRGVDALRRGPVRRDVIENLQRRRIRGTAEEAAAFLDEYIAFLERTALIPQAAGALIRPSTGKGNGRICLN